MVAEKGQAAEARAEGKNRQDRFLGAGRYRFLSTCYKRPIYFSKDQVFFQLPITKVIQ